MARIGYGEAAAFQASGEMPADALSDWRAAIARHLAGWYSISIVSVEPSAAMRARSRCGSMLTGALLDLLVLRAACARTGES